MSDTCFDIMGFQQFIEKFSNEYSWQPPEFSNKISWYGCKDIYESDIGDTTNPINTKWFSNLIKNACFEDLDNIEKLDENVKEYSEYAFCLKRCIQLKLIERSFERDKTEDTVSPCIPQWFRKTGWGCVEKWNCEEKKVLLE